MEQESFAAPTAHGPIEALGDGLWSVRGTFRMGPGLVISRTMTIARAPDGLVVFNAVRLRDDALLDALGRVAHVVKLGDAHGLDDPFYVQRYGATFWSFDGAAHPAFPKQRTLGPDSPLPGAQVYRFASVRRVEGAVWLPGEGGTLVTCDAIQHHVDLEGTSWFARVMTPLLGFKGGVIVPKMWRKVQAVHGARVREVLAPVLSRPFERLVTAHGPAVRGGASVMVERAIAAAST